MDEHASARPKHCVNKISSHFFDGDFSFCQCNPAVCVVVHQGIPRHWRGKGSLFCVIFSIWRQGTCQVRGGISGEVDVSLGMRIHVVHRGLEVMDDANGPCMRTTRSWTEWSAKGRSGEAVVASERHGGRFCAGTRIVREGGEEGGVVASLDPQENKVAAS